MYKKLLARRHELEGKEGGFTLIELLVVVVIIGILVAIAIPLYLHFENGAHTSGAQSDVNGLVQDIKQCQADNTTSPGSLPASLTAPVAGTVTFTACPTDTYNLSTNDTANYTVGTYSATTKTVSGSGTDFEVTVSNSDSNKTVTFESATGQTVTAATPA